MNILKPIIRKWILSRMAAQEFYFKQPFEINEEYPIMKSILVLDIFPLEAILIFAFARAYGSIANASLLIIALAFIVNILLANLIVDSFKDQPFINEITSSYHEMDSTDRKKLYTFKSVTELILFIMLPWLIAFVAIALICVLIPR